MASCGSSQHAFTRISGIPLGSIPGPTFFLLYISDLADDIICNIAIYDDDTTYSGGFWRSHGRCAPSLFFVITCFFTVTTNLFVLFEVELIINNAPLTYHYPNTIVTYLTLNHLLFGR